MAYHSAVVEGYDLKFNPRTGYWCIAVPIEGRRKRAWVSTGAASEAAAKAVIAESGVDRLILIARAGALTEQSVALVTAGRLVTAGEVRDGWLKETAERLAPASVRTYREQVGALFNRGHRDAYAKKPLSAITRGILQDFVNEDSKDSTRKLRLAAIRSLYRYARAYNFITQDLTQTIFVNKRAMSVEQLEKKPTFPLAHDEYQRLMASERVKPFWKATTAIAYWTGLRFVDCVTLEWASVKPDFLIVHTKKRGVRVSVPLDDPLLGAGELRGVLAALPREDPVYVFPRERETYLARKSRVFPTQYANLLKRHGIIFKSFHSTRHAAITRLAIAGRTLEEIGRIVGHANPAVTAGYVHGISGTIPA